jgi:hypothetical protein
LRLSILRVIIGRPKLRFLKLQYMRTLLHFKFKIWLILLCLVTNNLAVVESVGLADVLSQQGYVKIPLYPATKSGYETKHTLC